MSQHAYTVELKEPSKGSYFLHTVARSEAEALRIARRLHPRWHHVETKREAM